MAQPGRPKVTRRRWDPPNDRRRGVRRIAKPEERQHNTDARKQSKVAYQIGSDKKQLWLDGFEPC